ncbi:MAG: M56 family metallopeptidase, partial [Prosthecobacter sp.]|uniref:M56 family metallopeptidase n=1 Tax=Prosthecobacter sp. TaxID=1965333 RepID=UPI0019DDEC9A
MNSLTAFFDWLLTASLRASLLTLAVGMVQFILCKHLSPRWRYALWLPVLVVLLMPVLPESRWSLESVMTEKPQIVEIAPAPLTTPLPPADLPPAVADFTPASVPIDWQQIRLLTWASGAALALLAGGLSFTRTLQRFQRTRQNASTETLAQLKDVAREVGLRRPPRLLVASTINSPAVTGLLRPVLLLPAGFGHDFTPAEAHLILRHELTHLKRHDLPLNTLLCVLMALHWFNPLLWLAFFMARADREAACDAQVLENATPQRRSEYGHALLKMVREEAEHYAREHGGRR